MRSGGKLSRVDSHGASSLDPHESWLNHYVFLTAELTHKLLLREGGTQKYLWSGRFVFKSVNQFLHSRPPVMIRCLKSELRDMLYYNSITYAETMYFLEK